MSYGLNLGLGGTYRGLYRVLGGTLVQGSYTLIPRGFPTSQQEPCADLPQELEEPYRGHKRK